MDRPKRRKYKDNPYTLLIENNKYYVLFKDIKNILHKIEISKEVFDAFDRFELDDLSELNEYDNHIEHSEIFENNLNMRAKNKQLSLEETLIKKLTFDELNNAINNLPKIQMRRIKKYYYDNKTYDEIALEENCTKRAVKFSIDIAIEKISKKFKN